ncbi:hypothetical protein AMK21_00965 [Streptomyces sp. CB00316]|uniref:hypothetical protein n=1 Tax=Streptomyces sp. CB00316 TaxID=1703932 RepID=UPI00093EA31E|nr:hypothetical protein [Streptomyces sp. CB00316]OKJ23586.1 hypothetical protein AMK21_00965 [Streptomyces sp. CB00316]
MSESPASGPPPQIPPTRQPTARQPRPTTLRQRLAELRGPSVAPHPLDARALAALAANPGCKRRALLDGAGVDKGVLATALGSPAPFGQSQFAFMRGNAFEAKVKADGGTELLRLMYERLGGSPAPAGDVSTPDLSAAGPEGRAARTALALREATAAGGWALLDHPMLALEVAGSPAYLEPDAVVVHPDGRWTVVEIKSFPMIDASADAAKVGAAARQAAVYVLALERVAAVTEGAEVGHRVLLVCPKDFSNLPTASVVDVRKQRAVTRRQLTRLTRIEDIADALPEGTTFDPACSPQELESAVSSVTAAYAPECLAACELAFHCRARSRAQGAVATLGRSVRGELGGLTTVAGVLAAAAGKEGDPADPTVAALRRAADLRADALESAAALRAQAPEGVAACR